MHCHAKISIGFGGDPEAASFHTLTVDNIVELKDENVAFPCPFDLASD
jgi:hypothetical protein